MKIFYYLALCLSICISFCGCSQRYITAHTSYLNRSQLASYHVETPDPRLNHPLYGQRLYINWKVPHAFLSYENLRLEIVIRFGDRSVVHHTVYICKSSGIHLFELMEDNYFDRQGILTYKIDLIGGDVILEEWRHQLWVDLITVGESDKQETEI